jgi:hypothetical protein
MTIEHDPQAWMKLCVDELAREMAIHPRVAARPLTITAMPLDAGGYDEDGMYFGAGIPVFRVEWSFWFHNKVYASDLYRGPVLDEWHRSVRAPSAEALRAALIERLGAWGREVMCGGFLRVACEREPGHEGDHWNSGDGHWAEKG